MARLTRKELEERLVRLDWQQQLVDQYVDRLVADAWETLRRRPVER